MKWNYLAPALLLIEGPEGGTYSHFPAQIFTKSHRPTAQIPVVAVPALLKS